MSVFLVKGHSNFLRGLTKKMLMTTKKKGTGTQILRCGRPADPRNCLGTEKISWERFSALNS